jgi:predicted metalloprotease with PDZ domain
MGARRPGDRGRRAPLRWCSLALGGAVLFAAPAAAQTARDSTRQTPRFQFRLNDSSMYRFEELSPVRLRLKLDSLRATFDALNTDAPERPKVEREIDVMIRALEEQVRSAAQSARVDTDLGARIHREITRAMTRTLEEPKIVLRAYVNALPDGWIGINVEAPQTLEVLGDSVYVRYLSYPRVVSVEPSSPAEQAGIVRGDRLVAYNGSDVRARPVNITRLLQPATRITVTVMRDGAQRDFPLVVAKAPRRFVERRQLNAVDRAGEGAAVRVFSLPRTPAPSSPHWPTMLPFEQLTENAPLAGASLAAIQSERMGRYFGVSSGILVTGVFGDPAAASGLQEGDVIRNANGREVTTVLQLRRIVEAHIAERLVELEVIRHRKPLTVKLRW